MTATITMDRAGRLVLPKPIREMLHLQADVVADRIELTPAPDESVKLVRKGKRLVISGVGKPFDAVAAIKKAREEHDEQLARRLRGGAIYDYLHLVAARKSKAERLYALNISDFRSFHRPGDPEIAHP